MRIDEYLRIYEAKHDDELLLLAQSSAELTDEARAALQSELSRRGLQAEVTACPAPVPTAQNPTTSKPSASRFTTIGVFLNAVISTYRAHFWLFVGLIAPAIVFGYYGREFSRMFARHIVEQYHAQYPGASIRPNLLVEAATVGGIINFLTWICFCVCYAGSASAVRRIEEGDAPSIGSSFVEVLQRLGRFLGVSTVLCVLFVAGTACYVFLLLWLIRSFRVDFRDSMIQALTYGMGFLVALVLSRLAPAIPAVTLGNYTVRQSVFLSDEITKGKWGHLAALLLKSIVGGYIAGMLPFWIAGWVWPHVHFYTWTLTAASIAGVILVEPVLFIGFSLIYLDASQTAVQDNSCSVSI